MAKKNEGPSEMKEVQAAATIDDKEVLNNKAEEKEDQQKKLPKDEKETKTKTTSYEDLLNISEDWTAYMRACFMTILSHRRRKQTKMAKKNEDPSEMKEVQAAANIDDKEVLKNKAEEKEDQKKKLPKDEKESKTTTTSCEDLLNISEDWTAYESLLYDYFK
ncbi:uncharacterized protein G2W53_029606 [Senna tora]|uniref:Uncharacterized protein n=1 Tax=Senna tora TaxID=362788 RepID=A0A834T5G6_9FABA|nr:uncharacterized protein G2W53_029606 [Senna tora]